MLRILLLSVFAGAFSSSEVFAMFQDKEELHSSSLISGKKHTYDEKEDMDPYPSSYGNIEDAYRSPKRQKQKPIFISPQTKEKETFFDARNELVHLEYSNGTIKQSVASPIARKILIGAVEESDHYNKIIFEGKTVYQAKGIFKWDDKVLSGKKPSEWVWKTNLERAAEEGLAPIGYKGTSTPIDVALLTTEMAKAIIERQKLFLVNLHHLTQKDSGTEDDPICELTQISHKGNNACIILEPTEDGQNEIIWSGLEKKEAENLCAENQYVVKNILHFRKEKTHILRVGGFDPWRGKYWKARGLKEIAEREIAKKKDINMEEEKENPIISKPPVCRRLEFLPEV